MKRVISLIISIAMVASLATGLAVTSFAENTGITINGNDIANKGYGIDSLSIEGNTVTINKILETSGSPMSINIPSDKTLVVSITNDSCNAIFISGKLTITGGGTLVAYCGANKSAIYTDGGLEIYGVTVKATLKGGSHGFGAKKGGVIISNSDLTVNSAGSNGIVALESGDITIYNSKVSTEGSQYGINAAAGNITISGGTVSATSLNGNAIESAKNITVFDGIVTATANGSEKSGIYANNGNITISGSTINATGNKNGIYTKGGNLEINNDTTVTAIAKDFAICVEEGLDGGNIYIDESTVLAISTDCDAITAGKKIIITNSDITANENNYGISAGDELVISSNKPVKAKGSEHAFFSNKSIIVNGETITEDNYANYFYCDDGVDVIYDSRVKTIKSSPTDKWVYVKQNSNPEDLDEDPEENDPEVELDLGNGPVTLKTSNNSVVFNDTKVFEVSIGDGDIFVPIDLSSVPKKIDGLFFNNEVYRYIDNAGKDIKIINRFAYAEVYTNKEIGLNPLSLHLSDVSEIAGTCATAIQKNAMETSKVYAQVNYSFVSNGKPVENDAKIYVPVDGPAKVFYLFNENKIGIVPCEVKDGYCEFNRYFDGTYVVCAK